MINSSWGLLFFKCVLCRSEIATDIQTYVSSQSCSRVSVFFRAMLPPRQTLMRLEKSVVRIVTQTSQGIGTGTGFVINDQGYIATNVHVIADGSLIKAIPTNSNTMYDVDVIAMSYELDSGNRTHVRDQSSADYAFARAVEKGTEGMGYRLSGWS